MNSGQTRRHMFKHVAVRCFMHFDGAALTTAITENCCVFILHSTKGGASQSSIGGLFRSAVSDCKHLGRESCSCQCLHTLVQLFVNIHNQTRERFLPISHVSNGLTFNKTVPMPTIQIYFKLHSSLDFHSGPLSSPWRQWGCYSLFTDSKAEA